MPRRTSGAAGRPLAQVLHAGICRQEDIKKIWVRSLPAL